MAKSKNIDMLHGSLWDKMVIFALPLALTGMLQQLYNAADVAVLGKFVGTTAMAAVGNNIAIIGIIVNLFLGLSLGGNVIYVGSCFMPKRDFGYSLANCVQKGCC